MATANYESPRRTWILLLCAAGIMMITMGARQSTGLFISPINTSTGLGIVAISFAAAIAQLVWGASQPVFGVFADKYGSVPVLIFGGLLLAAGTALIPLMHSEAGLIVSMGILSAAGAGAGSFSILIGATAKRISPKKRSFAAGFINAGGSFGQFVFAPLMQLIIASAGWVNAMFSLAALTLLALPLSLQLREPKVAGSATASDVSPVDASADASPDSVRASTAEAPALPLGKQLRAAFRDPSYLYLHAGFFTCGFHIAFLVTHLPGEVQLCGLPALVAARSLALIGLSNVAGSLAAGALGQRFRMKNLLTLMYASRAALIAVYLMSPKTPLTFYVFAACLGFTWLATVPPTAGLVAKLFGTRYLATLFGLTLLSHQIGGFFGAWLGGLVVARNANYSWMWYADIALASAAALINLPIREAKPVAAAVAVAT